MKKVIFVLIILCSRPAQSQVQYLTTIQPFAMIIRTIVGERGEVLGILPAGASPHTYELRPSDLRKVESATALFVGGKNLDDWALNFRNQNTFILLEMVPAEYLLFMSNEIDLIVDHRDGESHEGHHHEAGSIDTHFWTDPLLVKSLLPRLTDTLCALDPVGSSLYRENSDRFAVQLDSIYTNIRNMLLPVKGKRVILSHPFFQYFLKRFEIRFAGSIEFSPGLEPTPKEMKKMIDIIKHETIEAIFTHPQLPDRPAKLIAEASGIKVVELDPLGGSPSLLNYGELLRHNAVKILEAFR